MPSKSEHIRKAATNLNTLFIGAVDDQWQMFSDDPDDYSIGLPIGFGASSIVYAARYIPMDGSSTLPCAVKVVDLDKLPPQSLRLLRRETQLMSLSKHPNVLRVRGSWITGHKLYIALRLMNSGSAADVMRYGWPGGMEEDVVRCILKQALEGLNYLHTNGFIHRDIKAANLLIDDDGTVLLGDLGVAASLCDEEAMPVPSSSRPWVNFDATSDANNSRQTTPGAPSKKLGKRKSFVGTPCWMAPELISGKQYDAKADIWSFGITAIELTQGRAPRSRETPARVLLRTVHEEPPAFARESGQYKFSKAFKDVVDGCLVKDPSCRPSAAELLESPFFKSAKRKIYLVGAILKDLPPLVSRQERRANPSLTAPSRSSMSSWDFTLELPHTPITTHSQLRSQLSSSPHPSFFSTTHSHQSHRHSWTRPTSVRLDALEESAIADVLVQVKLARPGLQGGEGSRSALSSPRSSVFDLSSESNPTTPEVATASLPASSAVTTPLSCSPAMALNMPVDPGGSVAVRGSNNADSDVSNSTPGPPLDASSFFSARVPPSRSPAQQLARPAYSRRDSSPASARPRVAALPTLKRMMSASAQPIAKASAVAALVYHASSDSPAFPEQIPGTGAAVGATAPKESRWRKLIRGSSFSKGGDAAPPGGLGGERKRRALGSILTGK